MTAHARRRVLVGVDIGSTSCKTQLLGLDGESLAIASATTPWLDAGYGKYLQSDELFSAVLDTIDRALDAVGPVTVVGVGTTGFAESGVLLGADGEPVAPILPWYDEHGSDVIAELDETLGRREFSGITGLIVDLKPSILKYRWLADHADAGNPGVRWLSVPEWVAFKLGGTQASEGSLASRTGFFDVLADAESPELLDWIGAPRGLLAPLMQPGEIIGTVRPEFPRLGGAAITIAGMDHLVAAVGIGAIRQSDLIDSCGTGEALIRRLPNGKLSREDVADAVDKELCVGRDVFADQLQLMGGLRSGIGMWRFLKLMGVRPEDRAALDEAALAVRPHANSPIVGDIWLERATLVNVGYDPRSAEIWRAAIESAQYRAAFLVGQLNAVAGSAGRILATGGGLESSAIRALKREILGEFTMPQEQEAASRGAALFAGVAAGVHPAIEISFDHDEERS